MFPIFAVKTREPFSGTSNVFVTVLVSGVELEGERTVRLCVVHATASSVIKSVQCFILASGSGRSGLQLN